MDESNKSTDSNHPVRPVANLAEAIFHRLKMYTMNGSLEEIVAFLKSGDLSMPRILGHITHLSANSQIINLWC